MTEFHCEVAKSDEDMCEKCKYSDLSPFSEPCVICGFNYERFEPKQAN